MTVTTALVWILLLVPTWDRAAPVQLGPFKSLQDCIRVQDQSILKNYGRICVEVNMVFGGSK